MCVHARVRALFINIHICVLSELNKGEGSQPSYHLDTEMYLFYTDPVHIAAGVLSYMPQSKRVSFF